MVHAHNPGICLLPQHLRGKAGELSVGFEHDTITHTQKKTTRHISNLWTLLNFEFRFTRSNTTACLTSSKVTLRDASTPCVELIRIPKAKNGQSKAVSSVQSLYLKQIQMKTSHRLKEVSYFNSFKTLNVKLRDYLQWQCYSLTSWEIFRTGLLQSTSSVSC